jgi:hypothetical protein
VPLGRFIDRIGIELEGGWSDPPHAELHDDGSVEVDSEYHGEVRSSPESDTESWINFVRVNYPDEHNSSCGLHVHISLRTLYQHARLMDEHFHGYFLERIKEWARSMPQFGHRSQLWQRIRGNNTYCRDMWDPDRQLLGEERYRQVNFCAWRRHRTVEFRLLPMFDDPSVAIEGIKKIVQIVENFLNWQSRFPEPVIKDEITLDPSESLELVERTEVIDPTECVPLVEQSFVVEYEPEVVERCV